MGRHVLRNEKGFTLIEIIAVLVILGILAAVAVPKYLDMAASARAKSAQAAIAELKSRASMGYANALLINTGAAPTATAVAASMATDLGPDYVATFAATATGISVTVGTVQGAALSPVVTGFWPLPS